MDVENNAFARMLDEVEDYAILLLDRAGNIVTWNKGAEKIKGYKREEVLGKNFKIFYTREDQENNLPAMLINEATVYGKAVYEGWRVRKDGSRFWGNIVINAIHNEKGEIERFAKLTRDLTEKKLAEEQLLQFNRELEIKVQEQTKEIYKSEKRFRALIESSFEAIFLRDEKGAIFYQSPSSEKITGYTLEEVKDMSLATYIHPEDVQIVAARVELAIKNPGKTIYGVNRMRQKNGQYIWLEGATTNLLHDPNVQALVGNFRDITERKLAEEKIEKSEKRFRALIENNFDAISLQDGRGRVLYQSPGAERMLGYSNEETIGKPGSEFFHPDDVADMAGGLKIALGNPGKAIFRTNRIRHKDGHYLWVEGTTTNLLADENVRAFVGNFHDITERKLAEKKLVHANRLYTFISQINQTIVHVTDKHTLFKKACRIAVDIGRYQMAWIGEVDSVQKRISLTESAGIPSEDLPKFSNVRYDDNGAQEQTIKTEMYFVCNDLGNDLETASWKPFAGRYSLHSCIVLPIKKGGIVIATFNLYSSEINLFDKQEIDLLQEVAGDISFALDIFEKERQKKEIEDKIITRDLRLKQAQAIAQLGSWEMDFVTGVAIWSEEFCKIHGVPPDDNIQTYQSWIELIHPEDLARTKQVTDEGRRGLTNFNLHHRIVRKDGTVRAIYSQAEFILDANGAPIAVHGVAHDITEMKNSERAFAQSEANLRQLMDLIPQAIFAKDYNGAYIFVNKNFAELYGLTVEEMISKSINETIPVQDEAAAFLKQDRDVILSGKPKIIPEHPFTDHHGEKHIFHTVKVPYTIAGTNKKAALGIAIDITEQKKAEAERTKIITDMVHRNNDLEQFSYIVSHNLRAPVANIMGLVNIMQTIGMSAEEDKMIIDGLLTAAQNLDMVIRDINNILDLRYAVNEKRELVNFDRLLKDVRLTVVNATNDDSIEIMSDFSGLQEMVTVRSYLYSIFSNLISNSIKYKCPDQSAIVLITTEQTENGMLIKFKDNGLGINLKKESEFVFGLYKRFHFHKEGKGIGLFMVKTQVEALGGKITISSTVNEGTEFTIEFPN